MLVLILAAAVLVLLILCTLIALTLSRGSGRDTETLQNTSAQGLPDIDFMRVYTDFVLDNFAGDEDYINEFSIYDVDGNGIPELLISSYPYASGENTWVYSVNGSAEVTGIGCAPYGRLCPYGSEAGLIISSYNQGLAEIYYMNLENGSLKTERLVSGYATEELYEALNLQEGEGAPAIPFTTLAMYKYSEIEDQNGLPYYKVIKNNNKLLLEEYGPLYRSAS